MPTTYSDATGRYSFTGLAAGRYRVFCGEGGTAQVGGVTLYELARTPAEYVLDVSGGSFEKVNFAIALSQRPPKAPPPPIKVAANGPYSISGQTRTPFFNQGIGAQLVTLENLGAAVSPGAPDDPESYATGAPSIRIIPPGLLAHKQGAQQSTCWCWAIKPRRGAWEGYCSFIRNLQLPTYSSLPGEDGAVSTIPAMLYKSAHGMTASAIPTRLNLGKDGVQATVLAFDRDKLLRGYYEGAEFEVFEINYRGDLSERIVWHAGLIGNIQTGDLEATIELLAWPDLASRVVGRSYAPLCDVGRLVEFPLEEFGTGRCRNQLLQSGPLKADWTVLATVQSAVVGAERAEFSVSYGAAAISGAALDAAFSSRLAEGKVEFLNDGTGGINAASVRDVKSGAGSGSAMKIILHHPLAYAPMPGDKLHLTSGCQRTPEMCKAYDNYMNFRGFNPPGREGALRRFTG